MHFGIGEGWHTGCTAGSMQASGYTGQYFFFKYKYRMKEKKYGKSILVKGKHHHRKKKLWERQT